MHGVRILILILLAWSAEGLRAGDAGPSAAVTDRANLPEVLRWANDAEGGAPYIFHPPDHPDQLAGFEVELAEALCARLGCRSRFVQYNWANLIPGLRQGGNFDIVIAALERTPENLAQVAMSRPYFTFGQQLVTRASDTGLRSLGDLAGRRVGVLASTLSHRLVTRHAGIEARVYDENVNYFRDLELGRIDAVLTDSPIAEVHLRDRPALRRAGPTFAPSHYAIAVPTTATALLARIDEALGSLITDGTLERIYRRHGLWDATQAGLVTWNAEATGTPDGQPATTETRTAGATRGGAGSAWRYLPILLEAAVTTLWVTLASMTLAVAWGLALALARCHGPRLLRPLAVAYIEVFRGTPLLLQLYFIYFGLAQALGWRLSAGVAAVLTLGLNYAANEAENLRAGLEAVPRGQTEAALALGMSPALTLRRVLLPQALRISLPGMTNDLIALFKDSSIVSVIGLVELTKEFLIRSLDAGDYVGLGLLTAAIYLAMGHAASRAARALERRLRA
ncbi:MAG: ABC transporter permease subunit [Verrucomicrobia bacterium]|nr:ABC transporter permease subunit [Verrucomicrobiota bacterium]